MKIVLAIFGIAWVIMMLIEIFTALPSSKEIDELTKKDIFWMDY